MIAVLVQQQQQEYFTCTTSYRSIRGTLCTHTPNTISNEPLYDAQISAVLPPVSCTIATAAAVVATVAVVVVQSTAAAVAAGD
jgi:hypothetical protein